MWQDFLSRLRHDFCPSLKRHFSFIGFVVEYGIRVNYTRLADVVVYLVLNVGLRNRRKLCVQNGFDPKTRLTRDYALFWPKLLLDQLDRFLCANVGPKLKVIFGILLS